MVHSKMSLKFWYFACMQAAAIMRLGVLGRKLATGAPTFGDTVVIRRPDKSSFQEKGDLATFLHWSAVVPMGAWVLTTKEDGTRTLNPTLQYGLTRMGRSSSHNQRKDAS